MEAGKLEKECGTLHYLFTKTELPSVSWLTFFLGMCKEAKITFDVYYASEEKDSCGIIDATTLGQLIHHDFSSGICDDF